MASRNELLQQLKGPQPADQLGKARRVQQEQLLKQQVAAMPASPGQAPIGPEQAAQLGQQAATQRGQIQTQAVTDRGAATTQAAQTAIQSEAQAAQLTQEQRALDLTRTQSQLENEFSNLARGQKQDLYDRALQFQTDEQGRKYLNERQLLDFALSSGIKEEEWANAQQSAIQAADREIQMMEAAYRVLEQSMSQEALEKRTDISNAARLEILRNKDALERSIAKKKAAAANRQAAWQAGGTLIGGGLGFVLGGGPQGAVLGAQLGGGVGSMAAGATA